MSEPLEGKRRARGILRTLAAPAFVLAILGGTWLAFFPSYQTNDDVGMRLLSSGGFVPGSETDAHLLFINILLGLLLSCAYRLAAAVPWYDLVLTTIAVASACSIVAATLRRTRDALSTAFSLVILLVLLVPFFARPQFSMVSVLAMTAAMVAFLEAIVPAERIRTAEVLTFATLGFLVRFGAASLTFATALLILLPSAVSRYRANDRRFVRGSVALALAIVAIGACSVGANLIGYRITPGWSSFYRMNLNRAMLNEYIGPEGFTAPVLERLQRDAGLSSNDVAIVKDFFFADRRVYSDSRLEKAAAIVRAERKVEPREFRGPARRYATTALLVWILLALFAASRYTNAAVLNVAWCQTAGILMFLALTATTKEPPFRVLWPLLAMVTIASILSIFDHGRSRHPAVAALLLLASLVPLWKFLGDELTLARQNRERAALVAAEVRQLTVLRPELIVVQGSALPYEAWTLPFRESPPLPIVWLGAACATPPVEGYLRRSGYYPPLSALCANPRRLLVARSRFLPRAETFLLEHDAIRVRFVPVFTGLEFQAYRCERR